MVCYISCIIAAIFVIGMIYFYSSTNNNAIVKHYKNSLSADLQNQYDKITKERTKISYQGYMLGILMSLIIIFYNINLKKERLSNISFICIITSTTLITNYFYYILSPKSDWMLNHIRTQDEIKSWLSIYREMQYNYHIGLVFGILAVGILAFAFRC